MSPLQSPVLRIMMPLAVCTGFVLSVTEAPERVWFCATGGLLSLAVAMQVALEHWRDRR